VLTTKKEIVRYWASKQDECGLSVDWAEAEKLCWRCAHKRKLQRCHIIPRSLGGGEGPDNLVLLCGQCHTEAPNVADPDFMWDWLRAHAVSFYGTYWQARGFREYELVYGEKPFSGLDWTDEMIEEVKGMVKALMPCTSRHWGQGKINPSSVVWVLRQVDQKVRRNKDLP
jgi:hypothetical protein